MKELDIEIRRTGGGFLHDSRADVYALCECIIHMKNKINELVRMNNQITHGSRQLESKIDELHELLSNKSK